MELELYSVNLQKAHPLRVMVSRSNHNWGCDVSPEIARKRSENLHDKLLQIGWPISQNDAWERQVRNSYVHNTKLAQSGVDLRFFIQITCQVTQTSWSPNLQVCGVNFLTFCKLSQVTHHKLQPYIRKYCFEIKTGATEHCTAAIFALFSQFSFIQVWGIPFGSHIGFAKFFGIFDMPFSVQQFVGF